MCNLLIEVSRETNVFKKRTFYLILCLLIHILHLIIHSFTHIITKLRDACLPAGRNESHFPSKNRPSTTSGRLPPNLPTGRHSGKYGGSFQKKSRASKKPGTKKKKNGGAASPLPPPKHNNL